MNLFKLETPVMEKIKAVVDAYFSDNNITNVDILYFDFEPSEMMINDIDADGAVCVYGKKIMFEEGSGSNTGTQDSQNILSIDVYGFGDPLKNENDKYESTVKSATNRGEILTTLVYKAVQDRTEMQVPSGETTTKAFGTGINLLEKYPKSIEKFSPEGVISSKRGVAIYRSLYSIKTLEKVPEEQLGPLLTGSDWDLPTYNNGDEPTE